MIAAPCPSTKAAQVQLLQDVGYGQDGRPNLGRWRSDGGQNRHQANVHCRVPGTAPASTVSPVITPAPATAADHPLPELKLRAASPHQSKPRLLSPAPLGFALGRCMRLRLVDGTEQVTQNKKRPDRKFAPNPGDANYERERRRSRYTPVIPSSAIPPIAMLDGSGTGDGPGPGPGPGSS
jgi:hypothetical protein